MMYDTFIFGSTRQLNRQKGKSLAGQFRYLALFLDAYDNYIDRFVRQLQFSDTGTVFLAEYRENATSLQAPILARPAIVELFPFSRY
jgi:hypothetical protein